MIIRESERDFIMIRQHDHAAVSKKMIESVQTKFFPDHSLKQSVLYAVQMHDYGWKNFDSEPFWNDEKAAPYSFIDFPNAGKTILYKHGIDEVEKHNAYAGLLCSEHYLRFLAEDSSAASQAFVANEQVRQDGIRNKMKIDPNLFTFHFELLKLADNLSLFLCLHAPDSNKEETHSFFKEGIQLPKMLAKQLGKTIELEWIDNETVSCEPSLFQKPVTLSIPFKRVAKESISTVGLRKSYTETADDFLNLKVV